MGCIFLLLLNFKIFRSILRADFDKVNEISYAIASVLWQARVRRQALPDPRMMFE